MSTILYIMLGLALIGLIARWAWTRNHVWAMPVAWSVWGIAMVKSGVPDWIGWVLLTLTIAALVITLKSRKWFLVIAFVMLTLAVVAIGFAFAELLVHDADTTSQPQVEDVSKDASNTPAEQAIIDELERQGWEAEWYNLNEAVDPSIDKSTAGVGAFSDKPIRSVAEMLSFLESDEPKAKALLNQILSSGGGTRAEVFNPDNWVVIQAKVDFVYPGNTMMADGKVVGAGRHEGEVGEIFFGFYSPSSEKVVFVRGACANAQVYTPVPVIPTDDDEGLEPKSSNPADYKQPGDGQERDSGTGTRPKSTVTTPAETTPPEVVTKVVGGGGVVDTPTNPPGSESGVTAPGATESVEESVPEPEEGVNPDDGSANTGDPGLPAGF